MADRTARTRRAGLGGLLAWIVWVPVVAWAQVRLELRVPEAETHVLGDAIPLYWRFSNQSTQALGFLWEGCCRLNGRLEVRGVDRTLPTLPTGQALAHMFARADRLEPGVAKDYDTRVSDWVQLPGTGTYELRGQYRGVLPTQFPQVQRGLALWREMAESPPVRLSVLSVADYLRQREDRERRRGLRLRLQAPDRLRPLQTASLRLSVENPTDRTVDLQWPDSFALWVLNSNGVRSVPAAVLTGNTAAVSIGARGTHAFEFALGADRFESEPLGDYQLFVDLSEGGDREPRVPSNLAGLSWRVDPTEVRDLVESAAKGPSVGARNAPLKFLRQHLEELGPVMAGLGRGGWSESASVLVRRLVLASRLKALRPKPGVVELRVAVDPGLGNSPEPRCSWREPELRRVLEPEGPQAEDVAASVSEVLAVRRHVGWDVTLGLEPGNVRLVDVFAAAKKLEVAREELAEPLSVILDVGGTNGPVRLVPRQDGISAGAGVLLRVETDAWQWSRDGRAWERIQDADALRVRCREAEKAGVPIRVLARKDLAWDEFRTRLAGILIPGRRLDLALAE